MILGVTELLRLVREQNLVEGLSAEELSKPHGAGFDLRIGKIWRLEGKGFLGVNERETPQGVLVGEYSPSTKSRVTLKPGDYLLTETVEKVNMPLNLAAFMKPRSTLHRSGIITRTAMIDPGYAGTLHPALYNAGPSEVEIELGARYVNVMFFEVKGGGSQYRGQWQGGRASTEGREKQV